jgi:hypothetical protein
VTLSCASASRGTNDARASTESKMRWFMVWLS